jgi:hypothetical protein
MSMGMIAMQHDDALILRVSPFQEMDISPINVHFRTFMLNL